MRRAMNCQGPVLLSLWGQHGLRQPPRFPYAVFAAMGAHRRPYRD